MVPYLRAVNVSDGQLNLGDVKEMNFTPDEQRIFNLKPGDVLVTEGSGSLSAVGASAVWRGDIPGTVCFQNTLLRLRPRSLATDSRFLEWWCRAAFADGIFASVATGANIFHISADRVRTLPVRCPPLDTQRAIANFLDVETARIDALIANMRRMIQLLEERCKAQISRALWAQPGYRRVRLKHLTSLPTSGNRDHGSFTFTEEGVPCLRGLNVRPAYIDRRVLLRISSIDSFRHKNTILNSNDLVIVRSGMAGSAAVIPPDLDGCNCVDLVIVRKSPLLLPKYLEYVINSTEAQEQVRRNSSGALLVHFNAVDVGNLVIPYREIEDQEKLVHEIGRSCEVIEDLSSAATRQLSLLHEHRQALITAAVMGELEVPWRPGVDA